MVQKWEEFDDPVTEFKGERLYDKFKTVVHSHKVSGTFYRDIEFPLNPQPGDTFTLCMTSWTGQNPKDDPYIAVLKLTCENAPGIKMRYTAIIGEFKLVVVSRTGNLIEVRIASTE